MLNIHASIKAIINLSVGLKDVRKRGKSMFKFRFKRDRDNFKITFIFKKFKYNFKL